MGSRDTGGRHCQSMISHWMGLALCALVLLDSVSYSQKTPVRPAAGQVDPQNTKLEKIWNESKQKYPQGWVQNILESQKTLAKFGYGTVFTAKLDDRTKEAFRAYQSRNNLATTGELDYATWTQLQRDDTALTVQIPLGPTYLFNDSDWDNMLTAEGIWLEQGKEPNEKTPLMSTRIECFRSSGMCIAATHGATLLHLQYLNIQRWDKYEIETQPDDLPCGREYLHISRPDKSVLTVNTAVYKNADACTKLFGPAGKPTVSRLGDVMPLIDARLKASREASDRILVIPADAKIHTGPAKQ